jgi:hypothetical protein
VRTVLIIASTAVALLAAPVTRAQSTPGLAPARRPDATMTGTAPPRAGQEITVRTSLSQTALWVGDRVVYTVDLDCPPTLDVLLADFEKDKLKVEGLEILDVTTRRIAELSGHVRYQFLYQLTSYDTSASAPVIADWTVRYGRRGAGGSMQDVTPAGDLHIPGATLALRSTIADRVTTVQARDERTLATLPAALSYARPVGLGLVLVSAAPVVLWAVAFVQRLRPRTTRHKSTRAVRRQARAALEELRPLDTTTDEQRREGFGKLDAILRQHLADVAHIPAHSLTPAEISARLDAGRSPLPGGSIRTILAECERARFGPPHLLPGAEGFRDAVAAAETVLSPGR